MELTNPFWSAYNEIGEFVEEVLLNLVSESEIYSFISKEHFKDEEIIRVNRLEDRSLLHVVLLVDVTSAFN